jgi:hypothetical protein
MAKQAKLVVSPAELCEALGVEDPNSVVRVVLDVRYDDIPRLYIERVADAQKIVAALTTSGIEVRREDSDESKHVHSVGEKCRPGCWLPVDGYDAPTVHGSVNGVNMAWGNGSVTQNSRR